MNTPPRGPGACLPGSAIQSNPAGEGRLLAAERPLEDPCGAPGYPITRRGVPQIGTETLTAAASWAMRGYPLGLRRVAKFLRGRHELRHSAWAPRQFLRLVSRWGVSLWRVGLYVSGRRCRLGSWPWLGCPMAAPARKQAAEKSHQAHVANLTSKLVRQAVLRACYASDRRGAHTLNGSPARSNSEGSSFSGLFTRVEMGHIVIGSGG